MEMLPPDLREAAAYMYRSERSAVAHFRAKDPDVRLMRERQQQSRESGSKGGKSRRWSKEHERRVEEAVEAFHRKYPARSWNDATNRIGKDLPSIIEGKDSVCGKTIRNHAKQAQW